MKHDAFAVQYLLMSMDAPYQAGIACVIPRTPSSHHNLLPVPVSTSRITITLETDEDDDDDNFHDDFIQAHINLQRDDAEPDVRSCTQLGPATIMIVSKYCRDVQMTQKE